MERCTRLLAVCACVLATGCASVAGGNAQKMYVQAQAQDGTQVAGADCALSNDKGTWRITSPGDTSIIRSNKRMEVRCDKVPLPQGVVSVESSTRAAMFGNIIIGGVVGAVIDHSSGAAYEYPEVIKVIMGRIVAMDVPRGATPAATAESMRVANTRPAGAPPSATAPSSPLSPSIAATGNAPAAAARAHSRAVPPASSYAAFNNPDAVPLRAEGRDRYAHYLTLPAPKAFVVYETGGWRFWFNSPDSMTTLLETCAREGRKCWLYAVDDQVVWREDVQQRIGRIDQLGARP